ncbi:GNAT family N-acetyltransferase [Spirosoma sp. HMF4905]|uniref:GNAT family N-acetyltransferase n=1 Tax=Spirosoma arboris TaxID=2682092 RepID=A0A7K1SF30_9BACT|nr:arsenic resistance N-acetyltransferase ArsN2 [Spirosoma arboris]MVM32391.1 GNAT family N-acetyltransferase [Spirosoma arboris]
MALHIENAHPADKAAVISLLQQGNLVTDDLPGDLPDFVIAKEQGTYVGVAGIERFGPIALLRSVAVDPRYQGKKVGTRLVGQLLEIAKSVGLAELYLITTTADRYFERHGFRVVSRQDVPVVIQQTQQFSNLCPSSAIVMKRMVNQKEV